MRTSLMEVLIDHPVFLEQQPGFASRRHEMQEADASTPRTKAIKICSLNAPLCQTDKSRTRNE